MWPLWVQRLFVFFLILLLGSRRDQCSVHVCCLVCQRKGLGEGVQWVRGEKDLLFTVQPTNPSMEKLLSASPPITPPLCSNQQPPSPTHCALNTQAASTRDTSTHCVPSALGNLLSTSTKLTLCQLQSHTPSSQLQTLSVPMSGLKTFL